MDHKRVRIIDLYCSGSSIAEVAREVDMSPSGVMYHLKKSGSVTRKRSDAVRIKHHRRLNSYAACIPKNIPNEKKPLYFIGLSLYWGEGAKTGNTVTITNSDPDIILVFLNFLRDICNIDEKRLHLLIHYHVGDNEDKLISFWSSLTRIKRSQFYKSTLHGAGKKHSTERTKFGTISLRYSDSLLLMEIMKRFEELRVFSKTPE